MPLSHCFRLLNCLELNYIWTVFIRLSIGLYLPLDGHLYPHRTSAGFWRSWLMHYRETPGKSKENVRRVLNYAGSFRVMSYALQSAHDGDVSICTSLAGFYSFSSHWGLTKAILKLALNNFICLSFRLWKWCNWFILVWACACVSGGGGALN